MMMLMQPQSPAPQTPGNNPYDFIMGSPAGPPQKGVKGLDGNKRGRIILVAIVTVVVLIIGIVIMGIIKGSGDKTVPGLISIAQQQTEIARIAAIGAQKARSTDTKNFAMTTQVSLESDQLTTVALIKANKGKADTVILAGGKNTKTDALLTQAEQANKFDEVFKQKIQADLVAYQKLVKTTYDTAEGKKTKQALSVVYKHASLLLPERK